MPIDKLLKFKLLIVSFLSLKSKIRKNIYNNTIKLRNEFQINNSFWSRLFVYFESLKVQIDLYRYRM